MIGSITEWLDADPFFVFHFANAFERGGNIFIDYVQHESLALGYAQQTQKSPTLHRMTIDLAARKVSDAQVAAMVTEFPRVNDALDALPTRFVYLPTLTDTLRLAKPPSATFNTMMKVNTDYRQCRPPRFRQQGRRRGRLHSARRERRGRRLSRNLCLRSGESDQRPGAARRRAYRCRPGRRDPLAATRAAGPARQLDPEGLISSPMSRAASGHIWRTFVRLYGPIGDRAHVDGGQPYTVICTREQVAAEDQASPEFVRTSYVITGAWAPPFAVGVAAPQ
jgi:Retinal pigment epithelial membrane protein